MQVGVRVRWLWVHQVDWSFHCDCCDVDISFNCTCILGKEEIYLNYTNTTNHLLTSWRGSKRHVEGKQLGIKRLFSSGSLMISILKENTNCCKAVKLKNKASILDKSCRKNGVFYRDVISSLFTGRPGSSPFHNSLNFFLSRRTQCPHLVSHHCLVYLQMEHFDHWILSNK